MTAPTTQAAQPELLPCPFCGESATYATSNGMDGYFMECGTCGVSGPVAETEDAAIAAWNRRPAAQPAGDDPEHWAELRALGWYRRDCKVCGESMSALCEPAEISAPPVAEPPARTFSDFISNATPEEKEAVYTSVMERAAARQRETLGVEAHPPRVTMGHTADAINMDDLAHELWAMAQGMQPISDAVAAMSGALTKAFRRRAASVAHIYAGDCPDEHQPDARDPNCPACSVEWRAAGQDEAMREYVLADRQQRAAPPFDREYVHAYLEETLTEITGNVDPEVHKLMAWLAGEKS